MELSTETGAFSRFPVSRYLYMLSHFAFVGNCLGILTVVDLLVAEEGWGSTYIVE